MSMQSAFMGILAAAENARAREAEAERAGAETPA